MQEYLPLIKQYLPLVVPLLLFALILRRTSKARRVRVRAMWVRSVIILLMVGGALAASPFPGLTAVAAFVAAAVLGGALGYLQARHLELTIDPASGAISSKATQIGTILIAGLFAVRYGLKIVFPQLAAHPGAQATADAIAWTNGAVIFTAAMLLTQTVVIWLRTRPLVAEHAARLTPPAAQS